MDLLKKLAQFFVYSNVFVSFCVLALCQSTSIIIGVDSSHLLPFVFFSTLFAYNFQRILRFSPNKEQSKHLDWLNKNRLFIILITIFSLTLSVYYALSLSFSTFYLLIPASIISLFHRKFNFTSIETNNFYFYFIAFFYNISNFTYSFICKF